MPLGVVLVDLDGRFIDANDAFGRIVDLPREQILGLTWQELTHPTDIPQCEAAIGSLLHGAATSATVRKQFQSPAGRSVWCACKMAPIRAADGSVRHIVAQVEDISTRLEAERELLETSHQLTGAFHGAPIGVSLVNTDGRYLQVNPALCAILGRTRDELLTLTWRDITHPDDLPSDEAALARARANRESGLELEKRFLRPDGTVVWARIKSSMIRDAFGAETSAVVHIEDITERVEAQALAAEAEARFQAGFREAPVGMAIATNDGTWLEVNEALCRIFGLPRDELIGRTWMSFTHPDDVAGGVARHAQLLGPDGVPYAVSKRYLRPDGTILWADESATAVRNSDGTGRYVIAQIADVTERHEAEEALRESELRFTTMFESAPIGMALATPEGSLLTVNPALCAMTGYDRDALAATGFAGIAHPDDAGTLQLIRRELANGTVDKVTVEWSLVHRDGHAVPVEVTAALIRSDDGVPLYVLYQATDLGERRRLELQVQQASRLEAIGRLAGGVAHDFNNMLLVVRGYTHLLLQRLAPDDPARAEAVEIDLAAERAAHLVGQLLAFGRKQVLQTRAINLNEVVRRNESLVRQLIGGAVTLDVELSPTLDRVSADPAQLEQVIVNLGINARDALADNGTITIRTSEVALGLADAAATGIRPGRYALLAVSDDGVGMDSVTAARAFEPFFTTKAEGIGTGLGLATAHGIITQSGGGIAIDTAEGLGTTVSIYLPFARATEPDAPSARADDHGSTVTDGGLQGLAEGHTVLVVEDDEESRAIVCKVLTAGGYRVISFASPLDALAWLRDGGRTFDLLVSDVMMPGMRGPELAQLAFELYPGAAILLMSGYAEDVGIDDLHTKGVSFLAKPFTPAELLGATRRLVPVAEAAR